ncbi:MAG: ATP-binding cassette domain-containing protein [Oscillibacter sp.]|uniref:ABC transporter ATP-binding protein n=1 Tax=Oscillibacter sp. TaxID=1945593 RepID=UPI0028A19FBE|nr:ATP-binding cassette domain-containing protein [Oscillibacter sp.]MEA4992605.1 ATP-binding cassette domain-containing protein [Oscillibacter sp.]
MLEVREVTKIYNPGSVMEQCLFDKFSLSVEDGQFVSIVGSNGSGKTSLLNIICGSIAVESGDVLVAGESILRKKDFQRYATMGRVYQNPSMGTCPNLTMLENLSLADNKGKSFGFGRGVNKKRIDRYRAELEGLGLGLEDKLNVKMGSLSGGQRQAAALLMATMTPLRFLILDEHTAALDPKTAEVIMLLTDKIVREKRLTAMMVTHNLRYAVEYGDRLLMMDRGQAVLDRAGAEKKQTSMEELLALFNKISAECGN